MKLYHIDRFGILKAGQTIYLQKNICFKNNQDQECFDLVSQYYQNGISHHGINYLLNNNLSNNNAMPLDIVMDIVFEYERLLNYKNKLSRYQSFFALDKKGVKNFIDNHVGAFYKIYEVESDYFEKHNMALISGSSHYNIAAMAKLYWEDGADPYLRPIQNEYLLKFPVKIIKEVNLEEIEQEI